MNTKLLIVTDLGLLKAYKADSTPEGSLRLDPVDELVLEEAHHRFVEKVTDFAGRRSAPTQKAWGSPLTDSHNLKEETKRRLIRKITEHIEDLVGKNSDCGVWLAAGREINRPITSALLQSVRQRIEINLTLDLVHAGEKELLDCFAPRPV